MLPLPTFYDASRIGGVFIERGGLVAEAAHAYRKAHRVAPAGTDAFRIAAFGIDCQIGFCTEGSSLFVPGAVEDTRRTVEWLYRNLGHVTELVFSLDTHNVFQIFHPSFWRDESGNPPPPFTTITSADIRVRRYVPAFHEAACLEYVTRLEASGKYVLTVWPYHALLGGVSHALVPALMEASIFHALVRSAETRFEMKGTSPLTESYSVLAPEVSEVGGERVGSFNATLFDKLMTFDRVYVFGQAKSHCVLSTLRDMEAHIARRDPKLADKIWILEDATSPVPPPPLDPLPAALDFPRVANEAFSKLCDSGMHLVKTTDPVTL